MTAPAASPDILRVLCGDADAPTRTARTHHAEFPLEKVKLDPRENYRWGSEEAMLADLKATSRDPSDGSQVCTYEVLKGSIRTMGVEEPVGLVPRADGTYRVVYGFTRVLAAKEVGLAEVPAYVYDAALPEEEAQLLQLRENSLTLKRQVNWVAEVEMYDRLLGMVRKAFAKTPADQLPRGDAGERLTPKKAAARVVAKALGVSSATMRNRHFTLHHIDPRVVALSREGKLNYAAACEFCTGDAAVPFKAEFVTSVIEALQSRDAAMAKVTADTVRQTMRRLRADKKEAYEGDQRPSTVCGQVAAGTRQSPGALRDLCVAMWRPVLTKYRLTLASPAEEWEKMRTTITWQRIVGIGIAAADVTEPVLERGEDTGRAELQHEETAFRYVVGALVQAALAADMRYSAERFREWISSSSFDGLKAKRSNRLEFYGAVQAAMDKAMHRSQILPIVKKAREELRERLNV